MYLYIGLKPSDPFRGPLMGIPPPIIIAVLKPGGIRSLSFSWVDGGLNPGKPLCRHKGYAYKHRKSVQNPDWLTTIGGCTTQYIREQHSPTMGIPIN